MALVGIESGKTLDDHKVFDCDTECCMYYESGKCIYNIATIKQEISRACHNVLLEMFHEYELDHRAGLL